MLDGFCYVTCIKLFENNDRIISEFETIFVQKNKNVDNFDFQKVNLKICFYFSTKYVTICVIKTKRSDNYTPRNTTLMI